MAKFLLVSDVHIHPHKKNEQRLYDCLNALEWAFETAIENNIQSILFCGDLFQTRQKIDVLSYQKTFELFEKYALSNLTVYLLLGNHDLWHKDKSDISSVNPLRSIPNVTIIAKPSVLKIEGVPVAFLPYTENPIVDVKLIEDKAKILCGHVAIDGALLNQKYSTKADVSVEFDGDMQKVGVDIFDSFDRVFLGHYHAAQVLNDKVEYVGSPLQLNFGEAEQDKHIIIYDTDNDQKEYVKNTFSPEHIIINEKNIDTVKVDNNFLRVQVETIASSDIQKLSEKLISENVGSLDFEELPRKNEEHDLEDVKSILEDSANMISKYVDMVEHDLDRDILLKIGQKICDSAVDI